MNLIKTASSNSYLLKMDFTEWVGLGVTAGWIPEVKLKYLLKFLAANGYQYDRTNGSHVIWKNQTTGKSTVYAAKGGYLHPMVLKQCVEGMGLKIKDFFAWYEKNR